MSATTRVLLPGPNEVTTRVLLPTSKEVTTRVLVPGPKEATIRFPQPGPKEATIRFPQPGLKEATTCVPLSTPKETAIKKTGPDNEKEMAVKNRSSEVQSETLFRCKTCKKAIVGPNAESLYFEHVLTCIEANNFECSICFKKFALKRGLNKHLRMFHLVFD